ncbi:39S ribosomal protein L44, mitochondrial-like [Anneissia japonica]|uniref:39S ribosomal protein L44, mitochondrial-like n=1 Tax=Anneissia japonica TaxID=1529436 RepID=UPI0014259FD6|nr:39S ribosomal protein L44, mitochondrial-like [Anneissia japonica]
MAAPCVRHVTFLFHCKHSFSRTHSVLNKLNVPFKVVTRCHARWFRPMLADINRQINAIKKKYGKEENKPRSHQENWNYGSELYAFGKRLGEEFSEDSLRTAFTNKCYIEKEETARGELGLEGNTALLHLEDNSRLAARGMEFVSEYVMTYLRSVYPSLPQEAIQTIHDYLVNLDMIVHISSKLGVPDLTLSAEFPIPAQVLKATFMSIIGALLEDQGLESAGTFVKDFILTQLIEKDLMELWNPVDPMKILLQCIDADKRELVEPRIMRQVGVNTAVPVYVVGVYCDKQLLGWAAGESVSAAEDEATRVVLRKMFRIGEGSPPLPLDSTKHAKLNSTIIQQLQMNTQQAKITAS